MADQRPSTLLTAVLFLTTLLAVFCLPAGSASQDHYVGLVGSTHMSIQAAIDQALPGDTIYIANGTYNENITIYKPGISLVGNGSVVLTTELDRPTLKITADRVNVSNIEVRSWNASGQEAVVARDCTHLNISGCEIYDTNPGGYGVYLHNVSFADVYDSFVFKNKTSGGGIYSYINSDNITIEQCTIFVNSTYGIGIYARSIWTNVIGCSITTEQEVPGNDMYAYGMLFKGAHNCSAMGNTVLTSGIKSHGIYFYQTPDNEVNGNNVVTTAYNSLGIHIFECPRTNAEKNTVSTWGSSSIGIHFLYSDNCLIRSNVINTIHIEMLTASNSHGVYLYNCQWSTIEDNTVATFGKSSHGIYSYISSNNTFLLNHVETHHSIWNVDSSSHGIYIRSSWDEAVKENVVSTQGRSCIGIYGSEDYRCEIDHNEVTTHGYYAGVSSSSDAILLVSSISMEVHHNILSTNGRSSYGIENALLGGNAIHNNTIETTKESATGIYVNYADECRVMDNVIFTTGLSSTGISTYLAKDLEVGRNDIVCTGNGIYITHSAILYENNVRSTDASSLYVSGSTVSARGNHFTSEGGYALVGVAGAIGTFSDCVLSSDPEFKDVVLNGNSNFTLINCTLDNTRLISKYAGGGVIQVQNYLEFNCFFEDNITPLAGAEVQIKDNEKVLYASPGFGGADPVTDAAGWIGRFLVADAWWIYDAVPTQNITTVDLSYQGDSLWEGSYSIDMSDSEPKRILAGDMIAPPAPFNIQAEAVPETNHINVSWEYTSSDVEFFSVYKDNGTGFVLEANTTNKYYLDLNLCDNETAGYKVLAVDDGPNVSPFTLPVYIQALDITPPAAPINFTLDAPDTGGVVSLSWDINDDDTVFYIVYRDGAELIRTYKTTFTDLTIRNGQFYLYNISAIDDAGLESERSKTINITPLDTVPPDRVTGLRLVKLTNTSVEFTWDPSLGASEYLVYSNGTYLMSVDIARATIKGLQELSRHSFQVLARDASNNSAKLSDHLNITVPDWTLPGPISGFAATYVGYVLVRLQWDASYDAEYYAVHINEGESFRLLTKTTEMSTVATDLDPNTFYEFYLEAFDRVNNSVVSETIGVRTLLSPPLLISRSPEGQDHETNVTIIVKFDQPMDRGSVESSFKLSSVPGTYSWFENDTVMVFTPERDLIPGMNYTVEIRSGAQNIQGTNLLENVLWVFTTRNGEAQVPISDDDDLTDEPFNWTRILVIALVILVIFAVVIIAVRMYNTSEEEIKYTPHEVTDITKELKFHKENPPEELMDMNLKEMEESLALEEEMLQLRQKELEQMGKDPEKIVATLDDDDLDVDMGSVSIDDLIGPYGASGGDLFDPDTNNCPICKKEIGPYDAYCEDCQKFGLNLDTIPCPFCGHDNTWTATKCLDCGKDL